MTNKKSVLTKSLSLLLSAIMLFSMISVGIILPEGKVTAQGATYTVGDFSALKSAIASANSAGASTQTTIQLSADISVGETAAITAISGNVLFDFNGHNLIFSYTGDVSATDDSYEFQLPSDLQGTDNTANYYYDKAVLNVASGGSLKIINTSSTAATMECYTYANRQTTNGGATAKKTLCATSNLLYCLGNLIIGDTNTSYNNFTLFSQSIIFSNKQWNDYRVVHTHVNSFAVTLNGTTSKLKMYGGTIKTAATGRCVNGNITNRCFSLNLIDCADAEIYGGSIDIVSDDECGLRNTANANNDGGTSLYAAIRTCTSNLYIIDVDSSVHAHGGDDTKASTMRVYNILTNDTAIPHLYGGTFKNTSSKDNAASALHYGSCKLVVAVLGGQTEGQGWYQYAVNGNMNPGTAVNTSGDLERDSKDSGDRSANFNINYSFLTIMYFGDTLTTNGLFPWDYSDLKSYIAAKNTSNDAQYTSTVTYPNYSGDTKTLTTTYSYHRNAYTQNGWYSSFSLTNYTGSESCAAAGTLFCYPKWTPTTYSITYDLCDGSAGSTNDGKAFKATLNTSMYSYNITSTGALPTASRTGYKFLGWDVSSCAPGSTDTAYDGWTVGDTYAAGTSVNGKYGNVTLKAKWEEIQYTATFDFDNIPAGQSGETYKHYVNYTVNEPLTFLSVSEASKQKDYYTPKETWKISKVDGSWTNTSKEYGDGTPFPAEQYGNVTFKAQYTPIEYTITFDTSTAGGSAVDTITYTYESTDVLPASSRLGYNFSYWKTEESVGSWQTGSQYAAGSSLLHRYGNVTLIPEWNAYQSTLRLKIDTDAFYVGDTSVGYSFLSGTTFGVPTKAGYTFNGWEVTTVDELQDPPPQAEDTHFWSKGVVYNERDNNNSNTVIIPGGKLGTAEFSSKFAPISYTIIYNTNGGDPIEEKHYTVKDSFTLPTPTKAGYTFTNWSVDGTIVGDHNWTQSTYKSGVLFTGKYGNLTLRANWDQTPYTITLDKNGGECGKSSLTYKTEDSTTLPTASRKGYIFKGWKLTEAASDTSDWRSINNTSRPQEDIYTDKLPSGHYGDATLTAQWEHEKYTITKVTNGTGSGSQSYYVDSENLKLGESTLSGYSFDYWFVLNADPDSNWEKDEKIYADDVITDKYGNVTVQAHFTAVTYTITYENTGLPTQNYNIEQTITLQNYFANGYTFGGWMVKSVDNGGVWTVGDTFEALSELSSNQYYGDVVLTPVLNPTNYKVTYEPNGGDYVQPQDYNITMTDELRTPTRTGYDFAGWKVTAAAGNWTLNEIIAPSSTFKGRYGTVTLTAQWTAKKYTITFITGSGTYNIDSAYDSMPTEPTAEQKQKQKDAQYTYTFDKWSPALAIVKGAATYEAQYTKTLNSYKITWKLPTDIAGNLSYGSTQSEDTLNYGEKPVYNNGANPTVTSKDPDNYSWRFLGWATSQTGEVLSALPTVEGNATYYARFKRVDAPQKVTWVIDGKDNIEWWAPDDIPQWEHDTPTKPDADGYTYTFTDWSPTPTVVEKGKTYTYTAQFSSALKDYTVTFDAMGGTFGTQENTATYQRGSIFNMPKPTRNGYSFVGWKVNTTQTSWQGVTATITGDSYTATDKWGDVTFEAQWRTVPYTLSFQAATPEDVLPESKSFHVEETFTVPVATRVGYSLSGWIVTQSSCTVLKQGSIIDATASLTGVYGDVILTPVWNVNAYEVNWVSGSVTQTVEVNYGDIILQYSPVSRMGYKATWDKAIPENMPAYDLTFTAVYTPVEYYARLNLNGGTGDENLTYHIESTGVLPTPQRDGADFRGWKVVSSSGNWTAGTVLSAGTSLKGRYGNVSLVAQWDRWTVEVKWNLGDVTKVTHWYYGAVPYIEETPYKSPDENYSYLFDKWDKNYNVPLSGDVEYTALFKQTARQYKVLWNIDGNVTEVLYHYGDMPYYAGTPTRASTEQYDFEFSGWSPEVASVTGDITYTAQFDVFTKVQSLSLNISIDKMKLEDESKLYANIYPLTASARDVKWSSSNPDIVAVNEEGEISAVSPGVAVICVSSKDEKFKSYCLITVDPLTTDYVEISAGGVSTTQLVGTTVQLFATLHPDNATNTSFTWSSSDPSVATVDGGGMITYLKVGKATIYAKANDGYAIGSIDVVVTKNADEVQDTVNTYVISFAAAGTNFVVGGKEFSSLQVKVPEGANVAFSVVDSKNYYVIANSVMLTPYSDGNYRLLNVRKNYYVITSNLPLGETDDDKPEPVVPQQTFFEKLQIVLQKIVQFFRSLFGG